MERAIFLAFRPRVGKNQPLPQMTLITLLYTDQKAQLGSFLSLKIRVIRDEIYFSILAVSATCLVEKRPFYGHERMHFGSPFLAPQAVAQRSGATLSILCAAPTALVFLLCLSSAYPFSALRRA